MPVNIPSRQLYIGGDWVAPVHGGSLDVVSPATEDVVAKIPSGTAEDVDAAVRAAQAAQKSWGMTSGAERSGILKAIAAAVSNSLSPSLPFQRPRPFLTAKHDSLPCRSGEIKQNWHNMIQSTAASLLMRQRKTWCVCCHQLLTSQVHQTSISYQICSLSFVESISLSCCWIYFRKQSRLVVLCLCM